MSPSTTRRGHARPPPSDEAAALARRLERVRRRLLDVEGRVPLTGFGPSAESARNLLHYVALRRFDLRGLQARLADLGLSSLGRAESHVLGNLDAVLARLRGFDRSRGAPALTATAEIGPERGRRLLARNASTLFGPARAGRETRIMVTLPGEAADRPELLEELLASGMDCARINCAHDSPGAWARMVRNLRRAGRRYHRPVRLLMDLGGPRLRTGPIEPGPALLKVRPRTDAFGRSLSPGRVELVDRAHGGADDHGEVPRVVVAAEWLGRREVGELIRLRDARGRRRTLLVGRGSRGRLVATSERSVHLVNGLRLEAKTVRGGPDVAVLGGVAPQAGRIRLAEGSTLRLRTGAEPGHEARGGTTGPSVPATLGLTFPGAVERLAPGDRIWFDGGRLGGVVRSRNEDGATVRIDHAPPAGAWLRADQGVNLPDTDLNLPPLTERDREDLRFIVRHGDLVGYSFVRSAHDVEVLRTELRRLGRPTMGVVLKIETRRAFEELPAILLGALRSGPAGVMLARGDLAVEVGFDRLAEVQEEILWLCEAAHLPAIWATQVLEGLSKTGLPSRAEVTDAAMGERAECVMLNKGPYLVEAVRALDSIVRRMQAHQAKKSARLRHLDVAERFLASVPAEPSGTRGRPIPVRASTPRPVAGPRSAPAPPAT